MTDPGPTPSPRPRRRWLRLSLRATMALVLLGAVLAGWATHRIRSQRAAVAVLRAAKQSFRYDWQMGGVGIVNNQRVDRGEPAGPRWLRRVAGDELFQHVAQVALISAVPPEALDALATCDGVEELHISDAELPDGWAHALGRLPRLRSVAIPAPLVTDAVLAEVARVAGLRKFWMMPDARGRRLSPATDAGFAPLAGLGELEDLTLQDCPGVTDAATARLVADLPRLRRVALNSRQASVAATLPALARHHPDLADLSLDRSGLTDDDLRAVGELPELRSLSLKLCAGVTDAGLAHIRGLAKLEFLRIDGTGVADAGLAHLERMTRLRQLFLGGTKVNDAGLAHLAALTNLRALDLSRTQATDAALPAVARLPGLENLGLASLPGVTDAGLARLRPLTKLKSLDLSGTGVTPAGVAALRAALPSLRQVTNRPLPPPPAPSPAR